ncbi:hypothetical protein [Roseovarius sp. EL26]|uniref:hypothetical protein n=1 Tax=Roseovarius sp. EL26 TaxID=2126672 RepID=UPI000EA0A815|nr:hypothetical protein [Roseovarius sp. EL26]
MFVMVKILPPYQNIKQPYENLNFRLCLGAEFSSFLDTGLKYMSREVVEGDFDMSIICGVKKYFTRDCAAISVAPWKQKTLGIKRSEIELIFEGELLNRDNNQALEANKLCDAKMHDKLGLD